MPGRNDIGLDRKITQNNLRQDSLFRSIPNSRQTNTSSKRHVSAQYLGGINDIGPVKYVRKAQASRTMQPAFPRTNVFHQPIKSHPTQHPSVQPTLKVLHPQPFAKPAKPRTQASNVLRRTSVSIPKPTKPVKKRRYLKVNKTQSVLVVMAVIMFGVAIFTNLQTLRTNHEATTQVAALSKKASRASSNSDVVVPSTTKPSAKAISQYQVAADLARYLKIPKLRVNSRVMQVGVTSSGALATPNNVFDTAWYTGSAKPGEPGATLIDGHISSWTSHGVFYGLNKLTPGDTMQIVRGDGTILNYRVVKTQTYNVNNVDMKAAVTPVTSGKSGLNLISCSGNVIKGTSEFNQRIIVFAEEV